jgi:hypothetical protein
VGHARADNDQLGRVESRIPMPAQFQHRTELLRLIHKISQALFRRLIGYGDPGAA